MSVIEHVLDVEGAFAEASRVLRPGGVFWFYTASSMCPRQQEIRGFPLFGWYPDRLKRRIMAWAKENRPSLVGNTQTPAINWFTPRKARRMLRVAGFSRVYDQWDIPRLPEDSAMKRSVIAFIASTPLTKFVGNLLRPGCIYLAVK
jgi:hypothetical protein